MNFIQSIGSFIITVFYSATNSSNNDLQTQGPSRDKEAGLIARIAQYVRNYFSSNTNSSPSQNVRLEVASKEEKKLNFICDIPAYSIGCEREEVINEAYTKGRLRAFRDTTVPFIVNPIEYGDNTVKTIDISKCNGRIRSEDSQLQVSQDLLLEMSERSYFAFLYTQAENGSQTLLGLYFSQPYKLEVSDIQHIPYLLDKWMNVQGGDYIPLLKFNPFTQKVEEIVLTEKQIEPCSPKFKAFIRDLRNSKKKEYPTLRFDLRKIENSKTFYKFPRITQLFCSNLDLLRAQQQQGLSNEVATKVEQLKTHHKTLFPVECSLGRAEFPNIYWSFMLPSLDSYLKLALQYLLQTNMNNLLMGIFKEDSDEFNSDNFITNFSSFFNDKKFIKAFYRTMQSAIVFDILGKHTLSKVLSFVEKVRESHPGFGFFDNQDIILKSDSMMKLIESKECFHIKSKL